MCLVFCFARYGLVYLYLVSNKGDLRIVVLKPFQSSVSYVRLLEVNFICMQYFVAVDEDTYVHVHIYSSGIF